VVQHWLPLRHPLHDTICLTLKASRDFRPGTCHALWQGSGTPSPPSHSLLTHCKYNQTVSHRGLARCVRCVKQLSTSWVTNALDCEGVSPSSRNSTHQWGYMLIQKSFEGMCPCDREHTVRVAKGSNP
jgi:hypothetical protein